MKKFLLILTCFFALTLSAMADSAGQLKNALESMFKAKGKNVQIEVKEVEGAQKPFELFEVKINGRPTTMIVVDSNGKQYLITGQVLEISEKGIAPVTEIWKAKANPVKNFKVSEKNLVVSVKNPKGSLVIFSDPQCPYCLRFMPKVEDFAKKHNLNVYVYEYPLPFHKDAEHYAKSIIALNELSGKNRTIDFYELVLKNKKRDKVEEAVKSLVEKEGLSYSKFKEIRDSEKTKQELEREKKIGSENNISGTPTAFIIDLSGNGYRGVANEKILEALIELIEKK